MSWNNGYPNAAQSPGLYPAQQQANNARIKTMFDVDHVFNDTMGNDDGYHNQVTLINRADPGALPADSNGVFYMSNDFPKSYNGTYTGWHLPVLATIYFEGPTANVIGTALNATVVRSSTGRYIVTFPTALPNENGPFNLSIYTGASGTVYAASISNYTKTGITVNNVEISAQNLSGTDVDPARIVLTMYYGGV